MAFFIFQKNQDNVEGTIYKISETISDLNNLNINQSDYKIIEDNTINFEDLKKNIKFPLKYNNDIISFVNTEIVFYNKETLTTYLNNTKNSIKSFVTNNPNHPSYNQWNDYLNQLNSLNVSTITYPLNKSLEQYLFDLSQPTYNILQLP